MRLPLLVPVLAAACLAPLGASADDIVFGDGAFLPQGRLSFPLSGGREGSPARPRSGHAIEMSYHGAQGGGEEELDAGDSFTFEGVAFNGPLDVRYDYRWRYGDVAYRFRHFFGAERRWGIEGLAGIGHGIFQLSARAPGLAAGQKYNGTGVVLGVGGIWNFRPGTSAQARITGFSSGGDRNDVGASRFDLHVVHEVARNVALRAGVTTWIVSVDRRGSDIAGVLSGPTLGLDLAF